MGDTLDIPLYITSQCCCACTDKEKNKKTASQAIESTVEICKSWYKRYITTRWLGDFQLLTVHKSWSLGHYEVNALFNPILHTAWLDNHALTLKSNAAKYRIGEKSSFLHTFLKVIESQGIYNSSSNPFTFNAISLKKRKS